MRAIELNGTVSENRELHLRLPADANPGPAKVIVLLEERSDSNGTDSLQQFLKDCQQWAVSGRTKEEIDQYIEDERNSWDRGLDDLS